MQGPANGNNTQVTIHVAFVFVVGGCNGKNISLCLLSLHTFRSPEMFAPDRMPIVEGKKMANIWKKLPSGPLQSGFRFDIRISTGDREQKIL